MAKIALVTDTHFGIRQDSAIYLEHAARFFNEFFFPYCAENEISHLIHLGDVFDRQTHVNFKTLREFHECFMWNIKKYNMTADILVGNHDSFYKNTTEVNALRSIYETNHEIDNRVRFVWQPEIVERGGKRFYLVPWISYSRLDEFRTALPTVSADILAGHLEVQTFEMSGGFKMEHGISITELAHFPLVLSGHFHKRQRQRNVIYIGTPYQMDWGDFGQPKGFAVIDTERLSAIQFVDNPDIVFHELRYGEPTPSQLAGRVVRVIQDKPPETATARKQFDDWLAGIQQAGADANVVTPTLMMASPESTEVTQRDPTDMMQLFAETVAGIDGLDESRMKAITDKLAALWKDSQ